MTYEAIETDLANCNDFGGICLHTFKEQTVELEYLCFDENSEVVLEGNRDRGDFNGAISIVPALTLQTSKAKDVSNKSFFEINGLSYGVIEKEMKKDNTTIVYLDKQ